MKIHKTADYETMGRKAADIVAAQITLKPDSVLGLATGSTPLGLYARLVERHKAGELDFARVRTVNLDEYEGLAAAHPQSYRFYMEQNLFSKTGICPGNTHLPDGLAADPAAECARYDAVIRGFGGIDLQLLGIGHDGHIGFNEPGGHFENDTHVAVLTPETIDANKRFFTSAAEVPRRAYTMGIRPIMLAGRVLVVVSGVDKADIVRRAFSGPVTPAVPASILQMHRDVTLVGDEAALGKLL